MIVRSTITNNATTTTTTPVITTRNWQMSRHQSMVLLVAIVTLTIPQCDAFSVSQGLFPPSRFPLSSTSLHGYNSRKSHTKKQKRPLFYQHEPKDDAMDLLTTPVIPPYSVVALNATNNNVSSLSEEQRIYNESIETAERIKSRNDEDVWMTQELLFSDNPSTPPTVPTSATTNGGGIDAIDAITMKSTFVSQQQQQQQQQPIQVPLAALSPLDRIKRDVADFWNSATVEVAVCFSVLLSSTLVALSTMDSLSPGTQETIHVVGEWVGGFLALEVLGRWFSATTHKPGGFVLTPQFVLDFVVILLPILFGLVPSHVWMDSPFPQWIMSPGTLINLKLLRVLRLRRVLADRDTFLRFERAIGIPENEGLEDWQLQLARVLLSLFTLLSVSAGMIYTTEHEVNPMIDNYFNAIYFSMTTLTTVGFGDIAPVTVAGRCVVCASIIAGVAVPAQAAALVEALLERQNLRKTRRAGAAEDTTTASSVEAPPVRHDAHMVLDTAIQCDACGATLHWANARFCYSCGTKLQ
jgi:hypothetical protein